MLLPVVRELLVRLAWWRGRCASVAYGLSESLADLSGTPKAPQPHKVHATCATQIIQLFQHPRSQECHSLYKDRISTWARRHPTHCRGHVTSWSRRRSCRSAEWPQRHWTSGAAASCVFVTEGHHGKHAFVRMMMHKMGYWVRWSREWPDLNTAWNIEWRGLDKVEMTDSVRISRTSDESTCSQEHVKMGSKAPSATIRLYSTKASARIASPHPKASKGKGGQGTTPHTQSGQRSDRHHGRSGHGRGRGHGGHRSGCCCLARSHLGP